MINDSVKITETHITRDVGSLNRFEENESVKDNVDQFEVWKFGPLLATIEDLVIQSIRYLNHLKNYIALISNFFSKGFQ